MYLIFVTEMSLFFNNPWANWSIFPILALVWKCSLAGKWVLAFSAVPRKSHFHFLTIVELVPSQVLLQQPSGMDAQKFAVNGLQELFLSDVWPEWLHCHPEWSHLKTYHFFFTIEATQGRLLFVHEWGSEIGCLFVNYQCKRSICTMTKSWNLCQDGKNTSMLSGFILKK
jgi:hypothetical protein